MMATQHHVTQLKITDEPCLGSKTFTTYVIYTIHYIKLYCKY